MSARGVNAKVPAGVEDLLAGQVPESGVDAHTIQPFYTHLVARDAGLKVSISALDDGIKIAAAAD